MEFIYHCRLNIELLMQSFAMVIDINDNGQYILILHLICHRNQIQLIFSGTFKIFIKGHIDKIAEDSLLCAYSSQFYIMYCGMDVI